MSQIRRKGYRFEYAFVIHPDGDGDFHAHIAQHGDAFPDELFRNLFRRQGTGLAFWEQVISPRAFGRYLMRRPVEGLRKSVTDAEKLMDQHLSENGQRMIHGSPGFWRDERGIALGGLRDALADLQRWRTPPGSRWRTVDQKQDNGGS